MRQILRKRLTIRGFIYYDYRGRHYATSCARFGAGVAAGSHSLREDIVDVSKTRRCFHRNAEGHNFGTDRPGGA